MVHESVIEVQWRSDPEGSAVQSLIKLGRSTGTKDTTTTERGGAVVPPPPALAGGGHL